MTYEDRILQHLEAIGEEWTTTQEITGILFGCEKGDAIYNNHVEDVGKDMQKLKKKGTVEFRKMDTGHGYQINQWRLKR